MVSDALILTKAIRAARKVGQPVQVKLIAQNLAESEALRIEKRAIFKWRDRLCNASLGNRSDLEKAHDDAIIPIGARRRCEEAGA